MPKVSVVMSIYKEPVEWIKQSIDSILVQTFSDFEFIIVNDKPDRIENKNILNEYESKDPRITIITNEQNLGLTKSLNKGLAIAKGEYIARMDADDISLPERLEKQLEFITKQGSNLCYTSYISINENGDFVGKNVDEDKVIEDIYLESIIAHSTVMFERNLTLLRNPLYNEDVKKAQDYELWTFLYMHGCTFCQLKDVLLYYRISENQITSINKDEQVASFRASRYKLIYNYLLCNDIHLDVEDYKKIIKKLEKKQKGSNPKDYRILDHIIFLLYFNHIKTNACSLLLITVKRKKFIAGRILSMWLYYIGYHNFPQFQLR